MTSPFHSKQEVLTVELCLLYLYTSKEKNRHRLHKSFVNGCGKRLSKINGRLPISSVQQCLFGSLWYSWCLEQHLAKRMAKEKREGKWERWRRKGGMNLENKKYREGVNLNKEFKKRKTCFKKKKI